MDARIELAGLRVCYGSVVAVQGLDLSVHPGEVYGLLGPNGAGKTSTIACVAGLRAPDAGRVLLAGHELAPGPCAARSALGFVPQELALYDELSAYENARFFGAVWGVPRSKLADASARSLARVGLGERGAVPAGALSGGERRRLNLACALTHAPRALLLDEPTAGVDPRSRAELLELVRSLAADGVAVLYTTHHLEEAEALCERVGVLRAGVLVAEGNLEDLRARANTTDRLLLEGELDRGRAHEALRTLPEVVLLDSNEAQAPRELALAVAHAERALPEVLRALSDAGLEVRGVRLERASLETLFLSLTAEGAAHAD